MNAISTKAAIYARFSTELQSDRSIDDQVALCRAFAEREGLEITAVHSDRARSGGSRFGREGLDALMEDARAGRVGVVIVEALDRLSRDMEDLAGIHKRLTFQGVQIRAVHEGAVNTVLVGLRGLIGQLYREDNVHKIRRTMAGIARDGRSAGGRAYGYRPLPGKPGERVIVEEEAAIVRRIYAEYLAGRTPRDIACGLTKDAVPAPFGARWNASTIVGSRARQNGILHNQLYAGRQVWNRVRMVRDPDTGKRVSRENLPEEWTITDVPALAIVDSDTFAAAQARLLARGGARPWEKRRPRRILSGLLRCGACGAGMSTMGKDKSGRTRIRCTAQAERGDCPDPATFYLDTVEKAVLDGLRGELVHPTIMTEYVREYHAERQRLAADTISRRADIERRLAAIDKEAERVTDWLVKGVGDVDRLDRRAKELMVEESALREQLASSGEAPNIVTLHPQALKRYEQQLGELHSALGRALEHGVQEAADAVRDLVSSITLARATDGGIAIDIEGRLNALLGPVAYPNSRHTAVSGGVMVAEEGLEPPTRGL
ncbi:recombinase family protein [Tardibacter chloracetimidivorans]|uniref:Recombinase family protein n=1 Tax=Tardibacter chloracetimidivorans TaxID=1921510 RepID=A0A1L3ZZ51_9SPHN|nr:recombinase family protein [Tardibacter chloracetimidivorans]